MTLSPVRDLRGKKLILQRPAHNQLFSLHLIECEFENRGY
ncbi:hypothetical protein MCEMIE4_03123 [Sphingobium cupriresistens]